MRRGVFTLGLLLCAALAGVAEASAPQIRVNPGTGGRRTAFTISARIPAPATRSGGIDRRYTVSAHGPTRNGRCDSGAAVQIADAPAHARVRVTLSPKPGRWCRGTFHGQITETATPVCGPRMLCPMWVMEPQTIGTFTFRVR